MGSVRFSLLVASAIMLVFFGSQVLPMRLPWSDTFTSLTASLVSASASVGETTENKILAQLRDREEELVARERELNVREAAMNEGQGADRYEMLAVVGSGVSSFLFVLVLFNYYFDWRRSENKLA